jgi:hypothetical protein
MTYSLEKWHIQFNINLNFVIKYIEYGSVTAKDKYIKHQQNVEDTDVYKKQKGLSTYLQHCLEMKLTG